MAKLPNLDSEIALFKKQSQSNLVSSIGVKRDYLQGQYNRSEATIDKTDPEDYRKMWQNDGQVAAIVMLPRLMLLGAGYDIINADGDDTETAELKFVRDNLLTTSANGGIKTPLDDVIEDMTYAPFEGARYYELVYRLDNGRVLLDKIAPRDNLTCYPEADDAGDFAGFVQRATFFNKTREVLIPNEKAVAIIFNEAYGGLRGLSLLKAAWYHWDKKHKLYFISHLASELQTIPPKVLKIKDLSPQDKSAIEAGIDNLGLQSRLTIPMDGAEIEELGRSGAPTVEIQGLINHHNSQISKSLLAQFIDLGSEGSGGSRALGTAQVDLYMDFLRGLRKKIENAFNDKIIPRLVDYNFTSGNYPKLIINDLADNSKELLVETFKELAKKGELPEMTKMSIISRVSADAGLKFDEKEIQAEQEQQKEEEVASEVVVTEKDNVNLEEVMERRSLTEDERRINFVTISSRIDKSVNEIYNRISDEILDNKDEVLAQIDMILGSGNVSMLSDLQVANRNTIVTILQETLGSMYDFMKVETANEIRVTVPSTDPQQKSMLAVIASTAAFKLVDDLKALLINIVREDITKGVDKQTTKVTVSNEIDTYSKNRLNLVAEQNVLNTIGQARGYVFKLNEQKIQAYRYTAVLDSQTTEYCRSLDGRVFAKDSKELAKATPPIHFRCRSMLSAILTGEKVGDVVDQPIRGFGTLSSFKNQSAFLSEESEAAILKSATAFLEQESIGPLDSAILKILKDESK